MEGDFDTWNIIKKQIEAKQNYSVKFPKESEVF
jgi:hypothetical protein